MRPRYTSCYCQSEVTTMKHAIAFAVLLVMFAGYKATHAQTTKPAIKPPVQSAYQILPPVEYDRNYDGDLTITMVDTVEELQAVCRIDDPKLLACSRHNNESCIVVLVRDDVMRRRGWSTGVLLRHEIGHCNGWSGNHEGQRSYL